MRKNCSYTDNCLREGGGAANFPDGKSADASRPVILLRKITGSAAASVSHQLVFYSLCQKITLTPLPPYPFNRFPPLYNLRTSQQTYKNQ